MPRKQISAETTTPPITSVKKCFPKYILDRQTSPTNNTQEITVQILIGFCLKAINKKYPKKIAIAVAQAACPLGKLNSVTASPMFAMVSTTKNGRGLSTRLFIVLTAKYTKP